MLGPMTLAAIWLNKPVLKAGGERTVRITRQDLIRIIDGELKDCHPGLYATHEILECKGTATNQFTITCLNRMTEEIQTFDL